ncbi:phage tail sheath subtilisin-like domain-containing protein [Streptomyces sp. NPDC059918]|uniref:phage tail sheath subtilisin-like domain-containing protein n=1 Tax=unclassified Streptomyces TaxID=2593676 RepID=UPI0036488468
MPNYLSPGVYVEEVSSGSKPIEGVGTAVCAFVGFAQKGPVDTPTLVTNWTQFTATFGEFREDAHLPHSVYGYFLNGGGSAYIVRMADPQGSEGGEAAPAGAASAVLAGGAQGRRGVLSVRALAPGAEANALTVEVVAGEGESFALLVKRDAQVLETFEGLTVPKGPRPAAEVVRRESRLITVQQLEAALPVAGGIRLAGGTDARTGPAPLNPQAFIGSTSARSGIGGLEAVDEVTMLAVPDLMSCLRRGTLDQDGVKAVQLAMIAHCELMGDRVAVLDTPPALTAQGVQDWRVTETGYDSKYAALYWPWLNVMDPISGKPAPMPPSGHVAGVWARSDDSRGVHKAPANEVVRGALSLELALTRKEHDQLNPLGVNCIRAFPGQGIRIWGARTLSSDPEWRYLNVRRLFNFVEKSILSGTSWVVFEPNDPKLWDSVKRTITMFLRGVWRDGALFGRTPDDAFYVKCDEENNPPEAREQGILTVEIGVAAVKPAEFVVFRISQFADGASLDE